jgi:predicted branched-subunit amino acid permease
MFGLTNADLAFIIVNMRSLWRTASPELLRDVGLVCLADGIVGVSFGATCVAHVGSASGLAWWVPVAMSVLVFAGGSQIAAVGVVLAGGSPLAAVLAAAVLNTRFLPYGFAVADLVGAPDGDGDTAADFAGAADGTGGSSVRDAAGAAGGGRASGWGRRRGGRYAGRWLRGLRRLAGIHLITDEAVAFALRQSGRARRRSAFWTCGVALFVAWNVSVLLGVALGSTVRDTDAFGLDATFPAVMLALALPMLSSKPSRLAAGTGAVIAVALTPVLPAGLPLLAALGGLGTRWNGWRDPKAARTTASRAYGVLSGSRARLRGNGTGRHPAPARGPGASMTTPYSAADAAGQQELSAGGNQ